MVLEVSQFRVFDFKIRVGSGCEFGYKSIPIPSRNPVPNLKLFTNQALNLDEYNRIRARIRNQVHNLDPDSQPDPDQIHNRNRESSWIRRLIHIRNGVRDLESEW
jgi:hypothetical protein